MSDIFYTRQHLGYATPPLADFDVILLAASLRDFMQTPALFAFSIKEGAPFSFHVVTL